MFSYFTILLYVLLFLFNTNINLHNIYTIFSDRFCYISIISLYFYMFNVCWDEPYPRWEARRWYFWTNEMVPPVDSLSWCVYNSNFTMVFVGDISIVNGFYKPITFGGGTTLYNYTINHNELGVICAITYYNIDFASVFVNVLWYVSF